MEHKDKTDVATPRTPWSVLGYVFGIFLIIAFYSVLRDASDQIMALQTRIDALEKQSQFSSNAFGGGAPPNTRASQREREPHPFEKYMDYSSLNKRLENIEANITALGGDVLQAGYPFRKSFHGVIGELERRLDGTEEDIKRLRESIDDLDFEVTHRRR